MLAGQNSESDSPHPIAEEDTLQAPFLPKTKMQSATRSSSSGGGRPDLSSHERRYSSQRKMIYGTTAGNGKQRQSYAHSSSQHPHAHPHGQQQQRKASQASQASTQHEESEMPHQAISQIIGVAVLEFGVLLHSFVIGMTLAVVERFLTLFIVITLHRQSTFPARSTSLLTLMERFSIDRNVRRSRLGSKTGKPLPAEKDALGTDHRGNPICVHNACRVSYRPTRPKELFCRFPNGAYRVWRIGCTVCWSATGA